MGVETVPTVEKQPQTDVDGLGEGTVVQRSVQEEAAIRATHTSDLDPHTVQSATEYFLSDEPEAPTHLAFEVNVAAAGRPPRWVRWVVRSLQRAEIREIREDSIDPNTGREDDMEVNMRILIAASVDPDFKDAAVRGKYADPADLVNRKFAHKPGIIEAIARKANEMSGYGNAQIIRSVDAAGN